MLLYSIARRLSWSSTVARPASRYMSTSTTSSSIEFGKLTNLMIVRCRSQLYPGHNITEPIVCGWNSLPDPDAPPPKVEAGLLDLFQEIRVTLSLSASARLVFVSVLGVSLPAFASSFHHIVMFLNIVAVINCICQECNVVHAQLLPLTTRKFSGPTMSFQ
jgi:hypothetical protein